MILIPEENKCLPTLVIVKGHIITKFSSCYTNTTLSWSCISFKMDKNQMLRQLSEREVQIKGDFHEGLNFAGVHKLPFVCVIINNKYAISVPNTLQYAAEKLSDRAFRIWHIW